MTLKNATGAAAVLERDAQQGAIRFNSSGQVEQKVYFASGFTQYRPYKIGPTAAASTSPAGSAASTEADAVYSIGIPQGDTTTDAGWYWVVIQGVCQALVDGTTDVANGAFLEVLNAGTGFVLDHATAPTVNAMAIAREAVTADENTEAEVYLIGGRVPIAAS